MSSTVKRFIGIAKEETYGTPVASAEYYKIVRESLAEDPTLIPMERAFSQILEDKLPGPVKVGGDIDVLLDADMSKLIYALCGKDSVTTTQADADGVYKHEFVPKHELEGYTLEIAPGIPLPTNSIKAKAKQYAGTIVKSLTLEAPAREPVTGTVSCIANWPKIIAATTPTWSTVRPFIFFEGTLSGTLFPTGYEGYVKSFSLTIERDIGDEEGFFLGSRKYRGDLIRAPFNVSIEMDLLFLDWDLYELFYGDAGAVEPADAVAKWSLTLDCLGEATGSSIAGFENFQLKVEIPKLTIDASKANFEGREQTVQNVVGTGVYDATLDSVCKVTMVNKKATP